MKIETQPSAELFQLGNLIENMSVAMFTTPDSHGELTSRPMAPLEMDSSGAIWFFTDKRSGKVDYLSAVNLSFSDSARASYVSISGHGKIVHDKARIEQLWTPMALPWFQHGPESTNLALLKFVPHRAEYWDTPHSKMVRIFSMAASVMAGKPIGMGVHEVLKDL
jgi:general stress protein 26